MSVQVHRDITDGVKIRLTFELDTPPSIETCPGSAARVVRYADPELHTVWQEHGPEGEGVRTYWGDEESGDFWVHEGTTSGELYKRS